MVKLPFALLSLFCLISISACSQSATTYRRTSFTLEYEYPACELEPYANLIKESGVFEEVLTDLDALFNLPVTFFISRRLTFAIAL